MLKKKRAKESGLPIENRGTKEVRMTPWKVSRCKREEWRIL